MHGIIETTPLFALHSTGKFTLLMNADRLIFIPTAMLKFYFTKDSGLFNGQSRIG